MGKIIVGIDEAGRGPLAGSVYAAAVVLGEREIGGLGDSKALSEKKREALFDVIQRDAAGFGIGIATPEEIDNINILQATFLAMRRAVDQIKIPFDYIMVDGSIYPPTFLELLPDVGGEAVVKGDSKVREIMAAIILAKVARDRYMKQMAIEYPEYQFEKHKGYPTPLHKSLVAQYGPSPIHRKSFGGVREHVK